MDFLINHFNKLVKEGASDEEITKFVEDNNKWNTLTKEAFLIRDLKKEIGFILTIYPISEKKISIYKSLDSKGKAGFLSRYLMGIANKVGVSQIIIKRYSNKKSDWKFYNKNFKITPEKIKKSVEELVEKGKIYELSNNLKIEQKKDSIYIDMFRETRNLIELIIEKI